MTNTTKTQEIPAIRVNSGRQPSQVAWQSRYEGFAAVAYVNGKAIAGVSGPWSDKYALTWWEHPTPARQLELFDSLEAAKRNVEQRAQRTSRLTVLLHVLRRNSVSIARASLRKLRFPQNTLAQLRQSRLRQDMDVSGVNFHAFE